ncbi:MAG TPA: phosphotransferase family protein [Ilumatobacter sp.]
MATSGEPSASDDVEIAVRALLGAAAVSDLARLTGGASRETWTGVADGEQIVVQRQRPGAVHDMAVEAQVLRAALAAGVPVPEVLAFGGDVGGAPTLITRHVAGETIARKILRDERFAAARPVLIEQLARAAARLHRIERPAVSGLVEVDPLVAARLRLDEIGEPHPAFELAFDWLERHRPDPSSAPAVVHGDFRLGNVIVGAGGLQAVIDWELAHLGDPLEDLGWLCVPAWRFGSPLPAAGVGTRRQLLAAYADESGRSVDLETLRWWEVSGILRWGIICVTQAHTHTSGVVRSHELAAIGRRVCENEHDLFLALDGRW